MKLRALFVPIVVLACAGAWAQNSYTYSKLDESTAVDDRLPDGIGWGSCVACAGGDPNGTATISDAPFNTTPSTDGASRNFYINGSAYTDGLWWYKVGPNSAVSHFSMDFWLNVDATTSNAQAMEFDVFQFNKQKSTYPTGTEFMFGTQCNNFAGVWDVWDMGHGKWLHSSIPCIRFTPNTWYHITLGFHSSGLGRYEHYDSLSIAQYKSNGKVANTQRYKWGITVGSGPMPAGWSENMGLQFQMDIAGTGASMTEYVDNVTLKAW
jgi:hypothetical protein